MAKNSTNLRPEFDRDCNFITVKPMRFSGVDYSPGQPFDKTQTTTRRLRQLYDTRYLRMAEGHHEHPEPRVRTVTPPIDLGNMVPPPPKVKRVKLKQAEG